MSVPSIVTTLAQMDQIDQRIGAAPGQADDVMDLNCLLATS